MGLLIDLLIGVVVVAVLLWLLAMVGVPHIVLVLVVVIAALLLLAQLAGRYRGRV